MTVKQLVNPMRAADLKGDVSSVKFPCYGSPKLDGYRATVQGGMVLSKNNKPIANAHVQMLFGRQEFEGLDGELIVGSPTDEGSLQRTSSGVTKHTGTPDATFWVFDDLEDLNMPFKERLLNVKQVGRSLLYGRVVPQVLLKNEATLWVYYKKCLLSGYEGIMVRSPDGIYKQGGAEPRSTLAEGYCSKLKPRDDFEAAILGTYEQMENTNPKEVNELGGNKRSTKKAGKVGKGTLGGFNVIGVNGRWTGVKFDVGTGPLLTDAKRAELWAIRDKLPGKVLKIRSGKTPATFDAPQFPTVLDFRAKWDM